MNALRNAGFIDQRLVLVEDELVDHYNRALQTVTGLKTNQDSFHVDLRGESPELEEELGQNYLQSGSANRYMIVVSPQQARAGLIHQEFSFDYNLLRNVFREYRALIETTTRIDGMYGIFDNGIDTFTAIEDLLRLHQVVLKLNTPSSFLSNAIELQSLIQKLHDDPTALYTEEEAVPKRMLELVKQVGDIRPYNITNITEDMIIGSFYSRLFDGVYVFREMDLSDPVPLHRPGQHQESVTTVRTRNVIFHSDGFKPKDGPTAAFIPLSDTPAIMCYIESNGYASFTSKLLEPRLRRLEDMTLLRTRHNVATMTTPKRNAAIEKVKDKLPEEWYRLQDIQRALGTGHDFTELVEDAPPDTRALLLQAKEGGALTHIVKNVITKLWPFDYETMYRHNLRDLEHAFSSGNINMKKFIGTVIQEADEQW